jgi:predicted peptidase
MKRRALLLGAGLLVDASRTADAADALPRAMAQSREIVVSVSATQRYWLQLPRGYADDPARRWPMLVFLHGSGERGDDLAQVLQQGPPRLAGDQAESPFVLVSPQAPVDGGWDPHLLHGLLQQLIAELQVDPDRVSATGLSMGGRGVWAWAIEYPHDLAAIAPVCGEGDEDRVTRIRHLPVWAFHGEDDSVVPVALQRRSIAALRDAGGQPRLTTYPGVGHDAWTPAYADPALFAWLLAQRRPARASR